jgi:hypothetical protein
MADCLNMRCAKCGNSDLEIEAKVQVRATDKGSYCLEYTADSLTVCYECGHLGQIGEFYIAEVDGIAPAEGGAP